MSAATTIIGGGIGGFTVANELRNRGYEAPITIIDPEGIPYDRPPLSKDVLSGKKTLEDLYFVPASWYKENNVEVRVGTVTRIDGEAKRLVLDDGAELDYENLVIATGGFARRGATPGFEDETIILRSTKDAEALKAQLGEGKHLGIIGAGLIGAEVAAQARELGTEVTLVDPVPVSLVPAVGEEIAQRLHDLHEAHGVRFIQGMTTGVERKDGKLEIGIDGQDAVVCDAVLLCIGLIPEEALAQSLGLEVDNGVLVDHEQKTSIDGVWAVGDCARRRNADGTLERRHEHWDSAVQEAKAAAASIVGQELPQESASWFWSDRYGVHLEGTGNMMAEGETFIRPDADGKPAVAFRVTNDNKLAGAAAFDDSKAVRAARRIIDRNITVDPAQLIDPSVQLKKLAR